MTFHVSSTVPFALSVCRLGLGVDEPGSDEVLHRFPMSKPVPQRIFPGSYVHVSKGITGGLDALTLECWVRPWKIDARAALLGQLAFDGPSGFGLVLVPGGRVGFHLGKSDNNRNSALHVSDEQSLRKGQWHHVAGVWNGQRKTVWIDGQKAGDWPFRGPVKGGSDALRLGACGNERGLADAFFDGDLAMCAIYGRALEFDEIEQRFQDQGLHAPKVTQLLGCWTFAEEKGDQVADGSRHRRHGRIINHATWMIGGPSFKPDVVRFGKYDPSTDDQRGHALRLASDDLYDCHWNPTHKYRIPADAKSGMYVGRFEFEMDGKPHVYHVTFIVRRPVRRKKSPILVLAATNTWSAYSATPFAQNSPELKQTWGTNGRRNQPSNPPAYCFYRNHAGSQGTYQLGLRVPWPVADPYVLYGGPTDYSHLARADRFAQIWLEQAGLAFDVISDWDLHRKPDLLDGYKVFLINGHSEYWSIQMYHGLERYLARGGNVICLSGNSLFWRVSFSDDGTILECRKVDAPGDQVPPTRRGECWHSHDGLRGGLMRECGFPGWKLIGLETLGWNNQSVAAQFGAYIIERPDHFLFKGPHALMLQAGEPIGQAPEGGLPRANGHEIDVRLSTLAALQEQPTPAGAKLPTDPAGMVRLANGIIPWKIGGSAFDYFFRPVKPKTDQGGELIYWERPEGGRVFNAGSIGAGWALHADPNFQKLMRNVLAHFGVNQE